MHQQDDDKGGTVAMPQMNQIPHPGGQDPQSSQGSQGQSGQAHVGQGAQAQPGHGQAAAHGAQAQPGYAQAPHGQPQPGHGSPAQPGQPQAAHGAQAGHGAQAAAHAHPGHGYAQAPQGQAYAGQGQGYPGAPAAGQAPAQGGKKKGKGLAIGLGIGAVAIVGAVVGGVMFLGGSTPALPFDAAHLPEDTLWVSARSFEGGVAGSLRMRPEDVPEEAYWSALAEDACGGVDIFDELLDGAVDPKDAARAARLDVGRLEKSLACGKALAETMTPDRGNYVLRFGDDDELNLVRMAPLGVEELPDSVDELVDKSDPSNMEETRCQLDWPDPGDEDEDEDRDCEDRDDAIARLEGMNVWAAGRLEHLKEFGSDFSPEGDHDAEDLQRMTALADELSGYPLRRFGIADGFSPPGNSAFYVRAAVDKEDREELVDAVEDDAVVWVLGTHGRAGTDTKLIIVAESEDKAKDLEGELEDYLSALEEEVEDRIDKEEEREDDDEDDEVPEEYRDFGEALLSANRRSLENHTLELDGNRVILTAKAELDDDEREAYEAYYDFQKEKAVLVAEIVRGLADGEDLSDDDLDEIHEDVTELRDELLEEEEDEEEETRTAASRPSKVTVSSLRSLPMPGGGTHTKKRLKSGKTMHTFAYSRDPKNVLGEFFVHLAAGGWTKKEKTGVDTLAYELRKGSTVVVALLTKSGGGMNIDLMRVR